MNRPKIAITMGDPNGIGPELAIKSIERKAEELGFRPVLIGDEKVFADTIELLNSDLTLTKVKDLSASPPSGSTIELVVPEDLDVPEIEWGTIDPAMGEASFSCIRKAMDLAGRGEFDGVVNGPINKESYKLAGYDYLTELAYMGHLESEDVEPYIIGAMEPFFTVFVTGHIALREVPDALSTERVLLHIRRLNEVLKNLGLENPEIAVAGLNPHLGEGGQIGDEESKIIEPAVDLAEEEEINVAGLFPADSIFATALRRDFDGVVCMYHDQANIARKILAWKKGSSLYGGLSVPGGTTAHGTAFEIAGQGIADSDSMEDTLSYVTKLISD